MRTAEQTYFRTSEWPGASERSMWCPHTAEECGGKPHEELLSKQSTTGVHRRADRNSVRLKYRLFGYRRNGRPSKVPLVRTGHRARLVVWPALPHPQPSQPAVPPLPLMKGSFWGRLGVGGLHAALVQGLRPHRVGPLCPALHSKRPCCTRSYQLLGSRPSSCLGPQEPHQKRYL